MRAISTKGQAPVALTASIDRHSVAEQTYRFIRAAIVDGRIPQGARIVEAQIAKSMDVSRAPVREAVNRLLQEGLLESRTHHGPSVIRMTPERIRWLYDLRIAIEDLAIREVVRRRSPADLEALRAALAKMKRFAAKKDFTNLVQSEIEFHQTLCELSANPYVVHVSSMINALVRMALIIDNSGYASLKDIADEHKPLVAAIEAGNAEEASARIKEHILSSLKVIDGGESGSAAPPSDQA